MAEIPDAMQDKDFATRPEAQCLSFNPLIALIPYIDKRKNLLSYISTCHDFYTAGAPYLLGFPCKIREGSLGSFYAFLKSKAPSSFLRLRDLNLHMETFEDDDNARLPPILVEMLSEILRESTALTRLSLDAAILVQNETIPLSVAAMTTLKFLAIDGEYNDQVGIVMSRLQSPLRRVGSITMADRMDPLPYLTKWQQCLTKITVNNALCMAGGYYFPNVTSLTLEACSVPMLYILLPTFPNLEHLTISDSPDSVREEEDFYEFRESNIQYQEDHPSRAWALKTLTTDVESLGVLGLQCTIPYVTVTDFCPDEYSGNFPKHIRNAIASLKPLEVTLFGFYNPPADTQGMSTFFAVHRGVDTVKRLNLTVEFTLDVRDPKEKLDMLFEELSACTAFVVYELFMLSCTLKWARNSRRPLDSTSHSRIAEQYLDAIKMRKLARCAAWALPMLAIAHFRIETPRGARETYWTFNNDGSPVEWPANEHHVIRRIDDAFKLATKERVTTEEFDEFLRGLINPENSLWDRLGNS